MSHSFCGAKWWVIYALRLRVTSTPARSNPSAPRSGGFLTSTNDHKHVHLRGTSPFGWKVELYVCVCLLVSDDSNSTGRWDILDLGNVTESVLIIYRLEEKKCIIKNTLTKLEK